MNENTIKVNLDDNNWDDFKPEIQHRLSDILTRQTEFHKVEVEYWEEQLDDDQNKTRIELEEDIKKAEEHLKKIKLLKNLHSQAMTIN